MLMPHARNLYFARALGMALFISIISTFVYFGFIYKWRSGGKTSWEVLSIELKSKTKRVKMLVFFFASCATFFGWFNIFHGVLGGISYLYICA